MFKRTKWGMHQIYFGIACGGAGALIGPGKFFFGLAGVAVLCWLLCETPWFEGKERD